MTPPRDLTITVRAAVYEKLMAERDSFKRERDELRKEAQNAISKAERAKRGIIRFAALIKAGAQPTNGDMRALEEITGFTWAGIVPAGLPLEPQAPDPDAPRRAELEVTGDRKETACRSCGAAVIWITTPAGFHNPISVKTIRTDSTGRRFGLSHFADCPHGKGWRKGGAK